MATLNKLSFGALSEPKGGALIAFVDENLAGGSVLEGLYGSSSDALKKAADIAGFSGKKSSTLDLIAPAGLNVDRLIVVGLGKVAELSENDWLNLGGSVYGALEKAKLSAAYIALELSGSDLDPRLAASFAAGMKLRSYKFNAYKTKKSDDESDKSLDIVIGVAALSDVEGAWAAYEGVADGVLLARDLVDLPANDLGPVEFAARASDLSKLGVEVEILGEEEMRALKMNALLGVSQGAVRPPRLGDYALEWWEKW